MLFHLHNAASKGLADNQSFVHIHTHNKVVFLVCYQHLFYVDPSVILSPHNDKVLFEIHFRKRDNLIALSGALTYIFFLLGSQFCGEFMRL